MNIENCRRNRSRKLLSFLEKSGYPWNGFNPSQLNTTRHLITRLVDHFKTATIYLDIDNQIQKETKDILQEDHIVAPYGRFIGFLTYLKDDKSFIDNKPLLAKKLNEILLQNNIYKLYELLNRHYRELVPYWEICRENGINMCQSSNELKDIYNFFASPDIQGDVENKLTRKQNIRGNFFNKPFSLNLFYEKSKGIRKGRRESLLLRLALMMSLVPEKDPDNLVEVSIWLSDREKQLTLSDDKFIGIMNVNSGCTIKDMKSYPVGRIVIWREEECDKVLVHELIHALGLDFFIYDKSIDKEVYQLFDLSENENINIFETYTETWTVILSSTMYSLQCGDASIDEILSLIKLETAYSILQVAKILVYFGYTNFSNCSFFCSLGHTSNSRKGKFKQGSSILAYFVLKSALLYNLDGFVDYCDMKRDTPWLFNGDEKAFWELIKKSINDTRFISLVDRLIKNFNETYQDLDDYSKNSLRMTINEFSVTKM